ncbi:hypothetical protein PV325_006306 [Microctonus aethiopoides]|nr:hypothetical protein PV325_006306 [Microctonus aethiopoides]
MVSQMVAGHSWKTVYDGMQPASSQERGSGLALGCQGGPGGSAGGSSVVDQARDLSPCLPASMGDAARPTTLPCSPPAAHHHGSHRTPLHQTHCGTNNNCYENTTTPYDCSDYGSPGSFIDSSDGAEFRNNNFENPSDLSSPPQTVHHHHHHHHHHHQHHNHQSQVQQHHQSQEHSQHNQHQHTQLNQRSNTDDLHAIPKLEPPPTPPSQLEDVPGVVCAGCGQRISDRNVVNELIPHGTCKELFDISDSGSETYVIELMVWNGLRVAR